MQTSFKEVWNTLQGTPRTSFFVFPIRAEAQRQLFERPALRISNKITTSALVKHVGRISPELSKRTPLIKLTPLPAQISASNFHDLTQITQCRVCFNPKRMVFLCALVQTFEPNLKSHLSEKLCLRLTPRPPRAECALKSVRFGFFCALWVKAHSALCDLG